MIKIVQATAKNAFKAQLPIPINNVFAKVNIKKNE